MLPTGQILYGDMRSKKMWLFTGDGTAPGGLRPKVDDVVLGPDGSNSFTERCFCRFELWRLRRVRRELSNRYLATKNGSVFYATTSYWSNTDIATQGAQALDFILPEDLPAERYRLFCSGAGMRSKPFV